MVLQIKIKPLPVRPPQIAEPTVTQVQPIVQVTMFTKVTKLGLATMQVHQTVIAPVLLTTNYLKIASPTKHAQTAVVLVQVQIALITHTHNAQETIFTGMILAE